MLASRPRGSAPGVAVRAERLLDVRTGSYRGPVFILISAGRITEIVDERAFDRASAARVIDLGRAAVLPGLIDTHVHLQIGGNPGANARAILRAGFTTVVDLGSTSDRVLRLRDSLAAGSDGDPRRDLSALTRVTFVMRGGRIAVDSARAR